MPVELIKAYIHEKLLICSQIKLLMIKPESEIHSAILSQNDAKN